MIGRVVGVIAVSAIVVSAFGNYRGYTERAAQAVAESREAERVAKLTPDEIAAEESARAAEKAETERRRHEQMRKKHGWQTVESDDAVSGKKFVVTTARSLNMISLDPPYSGIQSAHLSARKHPRFGSGLFISVEKGQLHCEYNNCYISVRFDGGDVRRYAVSKPSDMSSTTWFIDDHKEFSSRLAKSKKTFVELQFFRQGAHTVEFLTEGFKRP